MSNASNLSTLANILDDGQTGQVLTSQGSSGVAFADAGGTGVTVHNNQAAMLTDAASANEGSLHYENLNNKLYVKQSSGFFLLASITNTAPTVSGFTETTGSGSATTIADNGTFVLTSGSNTVITLTATDPDLETLVYSATVTSGTASNVISSPSLPISNQSGNTFTLTPVTSGAGGTITIRFDVSDGNNVVNKTHSFSIAFTIVDSNYTTLLATATGTSDNNNITDSSSNSHSITVNGDAHAGSFSPYRSGGYATSFSRSNSSKLEIASMPAIGSGDCSIELWCKIDSQAWNGIISRGAYNSSGTFSLSTRSGDTELTLIWSGTIYTTSGANINVGEWKWVQIIRSSGTVTIYVNGSSVGSWSNSANVSSTSNYIIGRVDSSDYFGGDLRDLRISTNAQSSSNGSEKLATDSNTTFLSCHLPYLSYATSSVASNTYSSISGTIETVSNSPYDYDEYSATDNGGSVYFDGNNDDLRIANTISLSGDFTVSAWIYMQGSAKGVVVGSDLVSVNNQFYIDQNNIIGFYDHSNVRNGTGGIQRNTWNYCVWSRSGSTVSMYVNGGLVGTGSSSATFSLQVVGGLGTAGSLLDPMNGYISDLQIKSSPTSAANAVPPTAPKSSSGAELHIKGTDASIIDKSQGANLKLFGNTTGSTDQVRSGVWANTKTMKFDGSGDYISTLSSPLLSMGTRDFTIECWVNKSVANHKGIWQISSTAGGLQSTNYGLTLALGFQVGRWQIYAGGNSAGINSSSFSLSTNTWYHTAVIRYNGTTRLFIDGTQIISTSDTYNYTGTYMVIGGYYSTSYLHQGYIQDLRITKGEARYIDKQNPTANFTPPSAPLEG